MAGWTCRQDVRLLCYRLPAAMRRPGVCHRPDPTCEKIVPRLPRSKLILIRSLHTLAVNQSWIAFSNPFLGRQGAAEDVGRLVEFRDVVGD